MTTLLLVSEIDKFDFKATKLKICAPSWAQIHNFQFCNFEIEMGIVKIDFGHTTFLQNFGHLTPSPPSERGVPKINFDDSKLFA